MPLTVGTAGHIDHGKTSLVEALTGKNTDRLPEEHERGISIDLGYAPLELPDGTSLSVVDVPGHERFVRTMVAGASGIDLFLLVIDAGEGARPQTHEHLAILRLLGIEHGVVALTKADLVDDETLELARIEAEELVPGASVSPRARAPAPGSTSCGQPWRRRPRASRDTTPAGRRACTSTASFSLRGIGTVVTGTLWSGSIGEGDELRVEPRAAGSRAQRAGARPARRARRGGTARRVVAAGVERNELRRGDALVTPGAFRAELPARRRARPAGGDPARVMLHHGTAETAARVVRVGDRFAQLRLAQPVVAARGDRFVLRAGTTVGGGHVLDPLAPAPRERRAARGARARRARSCTTVPAPRPRGRSSARALGLRTEWLEELRAELDERLAAATRSTRASRRRRADGRRPSCRCSALSAAAEAVPAGRAADSASAAAAAALEGARPRAGEGRGRRLARFLEERGRLVRVGDGYAVSPRASSGRAPLVDEARRRAITLARFRDLLGVGRKTAQLSSSASTRMA